MRFNKIIRAPKRGDTSFDCNLESCSMLLSDGKISHYSIVFTADSLPLCCVYCLDPSDFKKEIHEWKRFGKVCLPNDPRVGILRSKGLQISVRKELTLVIFEDLIDDYLFYGFVNGFSLADFLKNEGIEI